MGVSIGLNGFGRIGRYLTRILPKDGSINLAVINTAGDNKQLAYLLKYDTVHGTFGRKVETTKNGIMIDGHEIVVTKNPIGDWKWEDYGVDYVVEGTGKIKDSELMNKHLRPNVKKVIITAPFNQADLTVVMGVNDDLYDNYKHNIISNASCTTNCLAPAAKVLHDTFGIEHGLMTTVHSYTMSQRILDGTAKDYRRGRAGAENILPTTTGAAKAVSLVIPELSGKLDGMSIRVPTPNVSLIDLVVRVGKKVNIEEINKAFKEASEGTLKNVLAYCDEPLVSSDFMGTSYASVLDSICTNVMADNMVKIILWYDNEASFTWQLLRLLQKISK